MNGSLGCRSLNTPPAHDPRAVANYILDACDLGGVCDVSNMKLQKLIYLAHRQHLGVFEAPLVKLGFEAWEHGPVSPIVYQCFKSCRSRAVDSRATMIDLESGRDVVVPHRLTSDQEAVMDTTLAKYGRMTASTLRELTHSPGSAWQMVWDRRMLECSGTRINDKVILEEFESRVLERRFDG